MKLPTLKKMDHTKLHTLKRMDHLEVEHPERMDHPEAASLLSRSSFTCSYWTTFSLVIMKKGSSLTTPPRKMGHV